MTTPSSLGYSGKHPPYAHLEFTEGRFNDRLFFYPLMEPERNHTATAIAIGLFP